MHMVSGIMSARIRPDTASDPAWKHVSNTETTEIQRSRLPSSHPRHTALFSDSVGRKSSWSQISRGEDACADHFRILSRLPFSYEPREKHRHRCVPQRDRRETTSQQSSTLILGVRASRHPSPVPPCVGFTRPCRQQAASWAGSSLPALHAPSLAAPRWEGKETRSP